MDGDSFELTIWTTPHHAQMAASLVHVDSDLIADGLPGGAVQCRDDLGDRWLPEPLFDPQRPYRTFAVTKDDLAKLAMLLDEVSLTLSHHTRPHALGETIQGFRLVRDFREISASWYGAVEAEVPSLAKVFRMVESLAKL